MPVNDNNQKNTGQPVTSPSVPKTGRTFEFLRPFFGSIVTPMSSQGETVAIASLSQKLVTQEAPLQAEVGVYTSASIGGLYGIIGTAFHSMNCHRARKNKDVHGVREFSAQLGRFVARVASVATSIASTILTRSGEVLSRCSSILGTVSFMSGTVAFSFRLYDMHKLKRLDGNIDEIHKEFFKDTNAEIKDGQIDRLGRALGDRDLAVRIYERKEIESSEIQQKIGSNFIDCALGVVAFLFSDAINIVALVIPIIKPLGIGLSLAANAVSLFLMDGKLIVKQLSNPKQMSTALKAAYIAQIILAVASIVASTVFTFGAVPIAIGAAAVVAATVPHILGWWERKKKAACQEKQPLEIELSLIDLEEPSSYEEEAISIINSILDGIARRKEEQLLNEIAAWEEEQLCLA